jgi:hypothetical protein
VSIVVELTYTAMRKSSAAGEAKRGQGKNLGFCRATESGEGSTISLSGMWWGSQGVWQLPAETERWGSTEKGAWSCSYKHPPSIRLESVRRRQFALDSQTWLENVASSNNLSPNSIRFTCLKWAEAMRTFPTRRSGTTQPSSTLGMRLWLSTR